MNAPPLTLHEVTKHFGSLVALRQVSLDIRPGTVHALLGENGAGKTTLMRIAYGLTRPDHGDILIGDRSVHFRSPADALAAGVGMVHQHFLLVPAFSVADNVALASRQPYNATTIRAQIDRIGAETGLVVDADVRVQDLSVAMQQRVEIIKALARNASLLIFDEPTAVLAPHEARELLGWIRQFGQGRRAAVLITHKLDEARAIADHITVLRRGVVSLSAPAAEVTRDALIDAMLGQQLPSQTFPHTVATVVPQTVIRATNIAVRDERGASLIRDASFTVAAGEVVGVAAVEGSGHRELLAAVAGRLPLAHGTLEAPRDVAFIPEDRQRDALILEFDVVENVALGGAGSRRGWMPWASMLETTKHLTSAFDVRTADVRKKVDTLSGGNQQKLVFAREMQDNPAAIVAVNPTRGLDVRASQALLQRLIQAREQGAAILVYSNDIDELLSLADRVLVVFAGEVWSVPADREIVSRAMVGIRS